MRGRSKIILMHLEVFVNYRSRYYIKCTCYLPARKVMSNTNVSRFEFVLKEWVECEHLYMCDIFLRRNNTIFSMNHKFISYDSEQKITKKKCLSLPRLTISDDAAKLRLPD